MSDWKVVTSKRRGVRGHAAASKAHATSFQAAVFFYASHTSSLLCDLTSIDHVCMLSAHSW
jgi:hypothetical protein